MSPLLIQGAYIEIPAGVIVAGCALLNEAPNLSRAGDANGRQLDAVSVLHERIRPSGGVVETFGVKGGLSSIAAGYWFVDGTRGFGRVGRAKPGGSVPAQI